MMIRLLKRILTLNNPLTLILIYLFTIHVKRINSISSMCPNLCHCNLDNSGRHQVVCTDGGMPSIPVQQMNLQTEVIIISAPETNENDLTIGPIFQQFKKLEELHIVHSNIPAIGKHTFWGVPSIQILNLTFNNITNIQDHNFIGLVNLLELHLSNNRIDSLPSATFRHLSELRVLTLANNRITELVPRLFLNLGKLKVLDMSGNPLKELTPEVFKDVQELRALRCRNCALRSINTQIYHLLPYLSLLDLGNNEFKYISHDEFTDLRKLKYLWLDGNQLPVVLENTFGNQNELESLSLARNRLAKITTTAFTNLTSLKSLDISYNKLYRLDTESFHPIAESLQYLNLSGNNLAISELKYVLQVVTKVQELGLAHMNLSDLPFGLFVYQENLLKLNLSHNNFIHFPIQVLAPLSKLYEIDLSSNRFRGLEEKVMIRLEQISRVHLENNSWTCDWCHIKGMFGTTVAALQPPSTKFNTDKMEVLAQELTIGSGVLLNSLYCIAPANLAGRTIGSLSYNELDWCSARTGYGNKDYDNSGLGGGGLSTNLLGEDGRLGIIAAGATSMLLIVTGIILTIAMCYSKRHAANYYTNEEKRGPENEKIFENPTAILGENGEISFKFPLDISQTKKNKVQISTIDEIKRDPHNLVITKNGGS